MCLAAKLRTRNASYPAICMSVTNSPRYLAEAVVVILIWYYEEEKNRFYKAIKMAGFYS